MKRKAITQATPKRSKKPALQRQVSFYIPRALPGEKKNLDVLNSAHVVAAQATSVLFLMNGCDDGTTSTTRIGRRISMQNLHIRWSGSLAATSAGASPLRLVVIYDKQPNAAAPVATDVFQIDQISSEMNLSNSRRFKVIVDENIECVGSQGPAAWSRVIWRDFTAKGTQPGLAVEFNDASTATITSITTGSLYAFVWQNGNIITAAPTNALYSRIRFVDA